MKEKSQYDVSVKSILQENNGVAVDDRHHFQVTHLAQA